MTRAMSQERFIKHGFVVTFVIAFTLLVFVLPELLQDIYEVIRG